MRMTRCTPLPAPDLSRVGKLRVADVPLFDLVRDRFGEPDSMAGEAFAIDNLVLNYWDMPGGGADGRYCRQAATKGFDYESSRIGKLQGRHDPRPRVYTPRPGASHDLARSER